MENSAAPSICRDDETTPIKVFTVEVKDPVGGEDHTLLPFHHSNISRCKPGIYKLVEIVLILIRDESTEISRNSYDMKTKG